MKPQEEVSSTFLKPHSVRIPGAVAGIVCAVVVLMRSSGHITETDAIGIAAAALVLFFRPKDRPFWFFGGIAVGVLLIQELPRLHSLLAR